MPETTPDRCITPSFSPSTYHRGKLMDGKPAAGMKVAVTAILGPHSRSSCKKCSADRRFNRFSMFQTTVATAPFFIVSFELFTPPRSQGLAVLAGSLVRWLH